jgi:hypothetical protein
MIYSMARQKAPPFHPVLSKVSPRTGTPIVTSIVVAEGTDEQGKPLFSLGKWAIPVNIAVLYQVGAIVNLAWPRASVYDLTGHTWWLRWSAVLFIGITVVIGYLVHIRLRARTTTLEVTAPAPIPVVKAA